MIETIKAWFAGRWSSKGGYKEILAVGMPLIISMGAFTIMHFTDRVFLSRYSLETMAASSPAGILNLLFTSVFMGTAEYSGVFVSQFIGANKPHRVGASLWQGIWFCLPVGLLLIVIGEFLSAPMFALGGHEPHIQALETSYFTITMYGSGLFLMSLVFSSYFSGQGLTRVVMIVNVLGAAINIPLDYMFIFGWGPIPEMGINGAGYATCFGSGFITTAYALLIFTKKNEHAFKVLSAWRFDKELFWRYMRYGLPGGVQMFIEILGFTFFIFMMGRYGTLELAASNIVFCVDTLVFLPILGLSITASILVGQAVGANDKELAKWVTVNSMHVSMIVMTIMVTLFLVYAYPLVELFHPDGMSDAEFAKVHEIAVVLLRFVAIYCWVDSFALVYQGALKGAGDTRFVMIFCLICSLSVLVAPVYILVEHYRVPMEYSWYFIIGYVVIQSVVYYTRFKTGIWMEKRIVREG
ncbi:MAG: MATE family efflux transporter [Desulfovibrio sp.]